MKVSLLNSVSAVLGTTDHTSDLTDGVNEDMRNEQVNSNWAIPTGVAYVRAESFAFPNNSSPNSFFPICAVFERIAPTGTVTANSCDIANLDNTCTGDVTWNLTGATDPRVTLNGNPYSTDAAGNIEPATLIYGINTVAIWDGTTNLGNANPVTSCSIGNWNNSLGRCGTEPDASDTAAPPIINLSMSSSLVRSGERASVGIEVIAPYSSRCVVSGVENSPVTFVHSGTPATQNRTETTRQLSSAQIVLVTCTPSPAIVGVESTTVEARVNIVPVVQEI
jgi:hypothetical protein